MSLRKNIIGFDRQLKNEWLNKIAFLVSDGNSSEEIKTKFRNTFEDQTSDALRKTLNLLMGIWATVPEEIIPLRNSAITLFLNADDQEKKVIHYYLAIANYPFFYDVCLLAGRSLRLSETIQTKQIITKIQEKWGDRSTTIRAVQRSIKTIEEWGWLKSGKQGEFFQETNKSIFFIPEKLQGFIANCILFGALRSSMLIEEIVGNPCNFPFQIQLNVMNLKQIDGLLVENRGKGDVLVSLRNIYKNKDE